MSAAAAPSEMPAFADTSAFLVARLENRTERELTYLSHEFVTGEMASLDAAPLAPGTATHWSCGAKRWLQGNVGCAIFGLLGPAPAEGDATVETEVLCTWSFPYSGEDRAGIQIGPKGAFTELTPVTLTTRFAGTPGMLTPAFATASHGDVIATVCFGRHPAIFSVSTAKGDQSSLSLPRAPYLAKPTNFVLCELANTLPRTALRLRGTPFVAGQCQSAVPPCVGPGEVVCWGAASSSHMSAIGRGNVGAAIFETFHVTDDADAPEPAELVVMWHLPTVGEPQVGCRIGSAGSFSSMDAEAQRAMIDDVNHHSTRPQQRSLLGYAVSSSFGRNPAKFTIGLDEKTAGDEPPFIHQAEGSSESGPGPAAARASSRKPPYEPEAPCFAVAELLNQTAEDLQYERAVFFGGAMQNAPDLVIEAGSRVYWTSGQGVGMDVMRGNLGAVVFTVGAVAEVMLVTHLSRLQVNPQCVGVRIGPVGAFTLKEDAELRSIVDAHATLTTTTQRAVDGNLKLEALASFGRDPARFLLRPLPAAGALPAPRGSDPSIALAMPDCPSGVACLCVCRLENRSGYTLQLSRAAYTAGEPRSAVDLCPLTPGTTTLWSCASPPGVKQGYGNEGTLLFGCYDDKGDLRAELAVVWHLPYTLSPPADNRVGALLDAPNSFSMMTQEQLCALSSPQGNKALHNTVTRSSYKEGDAALRAIAVFGVDPCRFILESRPLRPPEPPATSWDPPPPVYDPRRPSYALGVLVRRLRIGDDCRVSAPHTARLCGRPTTPTAGSVCSGRTSPALLRCAPSAQPPPRRMVEGSRGARRTWRRCRMPREKNHP